MVDSWLANLVQIGLGLAQQLLLVPVFLHFWTEGELAAWLAIYAAANLVNVADAGLQLRAVNRLLALKSALDGGRRTASFYAGMLQLYWGVALLLAVAIVGFVLLLTPSKVLGFQATPTFDSSFVTMTVGMALTMPCNLVSGLYRVYGKYARCVWWTSGATFVGQIAQVVAITVFGSVFAVATAYILMQLLLAVFLLTIDAPHQFPMLSRGRKRWSWGWARRQLALALPFGMAGITELALLNLPVLLVSALVADRAAVVQWGLTRGIAVLVRTLCTMVTLPVAAEWAHDRAIGETQRARLLYATASALVTVLACMVVSGLLSFWKDFFRLWTHGAVPCDEAMTATLMIGCALVSPSIVALGFATYSNRGRLLVQTKGLQLVAFVLSAPVLIQTQGLLGAALAIVGTDLCIQAGGLGLAVLRETLEHPVKHVAFLMLVGTLVLTSGWGAGIIIRDSAREVAVGRFLVECIVWLFVVCIVAGPFLKRTMRVRLIALIPC
jgi:hypothetical protein